MEKVRLTQEQADRLKYLKENHSIDYIMKTKLSQRGFAHPDSDTLNDLTLEELTRAIFIGYEIELPPTPEYHSKNFEITYNVDVKDLISSQDEAIYFAIKKPLVSAYEKSIKALSIEEAKKVSNTLDELIGYYYKYGKK